MSMDELDIIIDSGQQSDEKRPRRAKNTPKITHQSRFRWGWLIVLTIVVIALILGAKLSQQNRVQPTAGEPAPTFSLTTFEGKIISLESLRGKIVIVNFWASWCPPCHDEAPELKAIAEDYAGQNVVVVGVNWLDTESEALAFMAQYELTYPSGPDMGEKIAQSYHIAAAPENYVIDRDGIVADVVLGPVSYDHLAEVLDGLIAAGGAS